LAADATTICNSALRKIGAKEITSLSEDTKAAKLCNAQYSISRDFLFSIYAWNFAIKRATLTADVTAPAWGYANRFALPNDFIRLLEIRPKYAKYQIENGYILSNVDEMDVRYVYQNTTTTTYSKEFDEALAYHLASELAYALIQSNELATQMFSKSEFWVSRAKMVDSANSTPISQDPNDWVNARYTGGQIQFSTD
jgi:hypothetical protein